MEAWKYGVENDTVLVVTVLVVTVLVVARELIMPIKPMNYVKKKQLYLALELIMPIKPMNYVKKSWTWHGK